MNRNDHFSSKAARIATEEKLLELAAIKPSTVAGALLQNPEIFRELGNELATAILLSLIDRGQAEALRQLLGRKAIGRRKSELLAELLLRYSFR